jgi:hypothetical protein
MRFLLLAACAAVAAMTATIPAVAREGCGKGFHRTPNGRCVVNRAGAYYRNHGWWDGHRYWKHRYRHNNGWRYR